MTSQIEIRAEVFASFGANPNEVDELLTYSENCFSFEGVAQRRFPMADESFVK